MSGVILTSASGRRDLTTACVACAAKKITFASDSIGNPVYCIATGNCRKVLRPAIAGLRVTNGEDRLRGV